MSVDINKKQDLLLKPLTEFYSKKSNINRILPVINGHSNISLRIIDWFVTNYSKKYNIAYPTKSHKQFIVFLEYKSQLKAYSKKQFDPFCRRNRIWFPIDESKKIETTVGQLNFFRWAIEQKILDYIEANYQDIEKDMNDSIKLAYSTKKKTSEKEEEKVEKQEKKPRKKKIVVTTEPKTKEQIEEETKQRKKRHELSLSATRSLNKHNIHIIVDFG